MVSGLAFASPLTPDEALSRVAPGSSCVRALSDAGMTLARTTYAESGEASAYIFTPLKGKGFAVLSADDMAVPVLGYSDSAEIDPDNLPPALIWWLGKQTERLEYLKSKGLDFTSSRSYAPADMTNIPVLMSTTWNQDAPYNAQTPLVGGVQSPTGCVATSFAQVMNYFKYPERGQGRINYLDSSGLARVMSFNKTFEWDQMLDSYTGNYSQEQADAVSFLMKACGYSVEMNYGSSASGAVSYKLAGAAVTYFKYDKGLYYTERELYSADQWSRLVYDNLKNVGPVIYDGRSVDGGHSFVCDGYDGNGYFHFNWGWGGMSDGYYVLDSLNPESQGIGGADGGFNFSQGALFGMCPPKEGSVVREARMRIYGNAVAVLSGDDIEFTAVESNNAGWANASYRDINVSIGASFTRVGESSPVTETAGFMKFSSGMSESVSLGATSYYPAKNANPVIPVPSLPDGDYKVTLVTKENGVDNASWIPMMCDWGNVNYCYLKVEAGKMTVSSGSPATLKFDDCVIDSPLYLGRNALLKSRIVNDSDTQLTLCYSPVLCRDGVIQYEGDMTLATVNPGETLDKVSLVSFRQASGATSAGYGTYQLAVINRDTNERIATFGEYDMSSVASELSLSLDEFSVIDAPQKDVESGTRTFKDTYIVNDGSDFDLNLKYAVSEGYFDSSLRIIGARYNPETGKFEQLGRDLYYDIPFIGQGDGQDLTIPMDLSAYPGGHIYRLVASYMFRGSNKTLGSIYLTFEGTGIDSVTCEEEGEVMYFNLQGLPVDTPRPGQVLIRKSADSVSKVRIR